MFKVISPGILSTFQDQGRFGYRHLGVPVCGFMDEYSAIKANSIVQNPSHFAVLECTIKGPTLQCISPVEIVLCGIGFSSFLNKSLIFPEQLYRLKKGDILDIGQSNTGMRCYLAVRGGFSIDKILGSSSYDETIAPQLKLRKDQILKTCIPQQSGITESNECIDKINFDVQYIPVFPGPEFDYLNAYEIKQLEQKPWTIDPSSNRMALLLKENFITDKSQIISSAVQPGTIQLTPSGKIILLMKDAQTTGGYARIFQLKSESISILSQKVPGSQIFFTLKKL